jgi:rhodanese-related sulfurtransferase
MSTLTHSPEVSPQELFDRLSTGEPVRIIDVREYPEFAGGRLAGAELIPAGELATRAHELNPDEPVVLVCRSGRRSTAALSQLQELGFAHAAQLKGGIDAWQKEGLPVTRDQRAPWSLERQVRFVAGLLVLTGLIGSHFWAPAIALAWFVPAGLVFAALTDSCAMGMLLSKLPWNRPQAACRR